MDRTDTMRRARILRWAYPALEKALTGLGYADIYDDGCFAAYADRPVP